MAERRERRKAIRVALFGSQLVRTHEGLETRLLDLSLQGGRVAHFGILRPGACCFLDLPDELGSLRLSAQVLWCTVLGAEWRSDGERHLRCHSELWFPKLTAVQQVVLTGILEQVLAEDRLLLENCTQSA